MIIKKINIKKINNKITSYVYNELNDNDKKKFLNMPALRKKHFIAGRYLLLNNGVDIKKINYNINRKPFVDDTFFSISHSYDYTVVVINDKPVGVDIEKIRKIDSSVKKNFSNNNITDEEFIKLFTRKESYIKMNGLALKNFNDNIDLYNFISRKNRGYYITICLEDE